MSTTLLMTTVGALAILDQKLTMGSLIAANMLSGRLLGPLNQLVNQWRSFNSFKQAADRPGEAFNTVSERQEAEVEDLDGQIKGLIPSIPRAQAAVEEARKRVKESEKSFRCGARDDLSKAEQSIARIEELIAEAKKQGSRSEIKSPINGIEQKMVVSTVGGGVKPGDPILEIVPTGDKLVVEAKLNPTERGFIVEGQRAVVKISTYDFVRYGGLDGKVIHVAPDASKDENGAPFFRVAVQTDKTYLGNKEGLLPITLGMEATVNIHNGRKSVMDYLVKPVLKLKDEAFRER